MDQPIRETGPHLAELLRGDLGGDGPLYRQLADALRRAIDLGEVPLGTVLPPERSLARELAVSRATVVAAYDRLKIAGWLESRQGSGTWVRTPSEGHAGADAVSTSRLFLSTATSTSAATGGAVLPDQAGSDVMNLSVAAVPGSHRIAATMATLPAREVDRLVAHHGYVPHGLRVLRERLAERCAASGLPTHADQLLVTVGAHQGISLVARQLLTPGDTVLVESPTFPGALDVFRRFGARPIPVPLDEHGMRTELLTDLIDRTGPKLLYVTPHFQNPTGTVLPDERRRVIAELSAARRLPVLEDLAMESVQIDDDIEVPGPIAAYDLDAPVYTLGSMSKLFWAGLRVGWVRSPLDSASRTLAVKTVADLGSPVLSQLLALHLLDQEPQVLAERRAQLRPLRDAMVTHLREKVPDWSFTVPPGGLSLWCTLPRGNAEEFTDLATRHGVLVVPGPALSVDDGNRRSLRLAFANEDVELGEAVRRLALAWERYGVSEHRANGSHLLV